MLSNEEKKTLLKAIGEIWDKAGAVFGNFECKDVKESKNFVDIFESMVDFAEALKHLEWLVERY